MADTRGTSDAFEALARFFVHDVTLGDTLLHVAELACKAGPADMAGITMLVDGAPSTGVFTDSEAPEIDKAQYESGQGPCLDAFRDQSVYRIESTAEDVRWPEFAAHCRSPRHQVDPLAPHHGPGRKPRGVESVFAHCGSV